MDVTVDRDICVNSGMCTTIAPAVFQLDAGGVLVQLVEHVPDADEEAVQHAIACCPTGAILDHSGSQSGV